MWIVVAVVAVAIVLVAVAAFAGWFSPPTNQKTTITILGAGATFPYPLISKWSSAYENATAGGPTVVHVNYQSIGSGGGIAQITAKTVDFAGTDAPLKPSERTAAPGLLHMPETIGAVTAAYHLTGIATGLNLTGQVLVQIFRGNVVNWNDTAIQSLNPTVTLPNTAIQIVHRSDSSGTTFVWTSYLHASDSTNWNSSLVGKSINWPVGIGSSGNAGVAGTIINTNNAIGYVELAYAVQNGMTVAKIRNPAGNFILPSLISSAAAASNVPTLPTPEGDWQNVTLLNAAGANSYPVVTFTYLLVYRELSTIGSSMTQAKAKALVDFLWWAVHDPGGQTYSEALAYPKLPQAVITHDEGAINSITFNGVVLHT